MVDRVKVNVILLLIFAGSAGFIQAQSSGQSSSFEGSYSQQTVHVYVDDEDGNDGKCLLPDLRHRVGHWTHCSSVAT